MTSNNNEFKSIEIVNVSSDNVVKNENEESNTLENTKLKYTGDQQDIELFISDENQALDSAVRNDPLENLINVKIDQKTKNHINTT
jgi:hypothetical protein